MANIEGLRLALRITEDAAKNDLWDQGTWLEKTACGTVGCFAGHWALHRGWEPIFLRRGGEETAETGVIKLPDGDHAYIAAAVAYDLGLDHDQSALLFDDSNNLDDIRRIIDQIEEEERFVVGLRDLLDEALIDV